MALPALADIDALVAWTGDTIADDDPRALAVLARASALVRSECGRTWVDDGNALEAVPEPIEGVVVQVAARVWRNPEGAIQDVAGPFSARFSESVADGLYLTETERKICAQHRQSASGLWVMPTTRLHGVDDGTTWTPTTSDPDGPQFPW